MAYHPPDRKGGRRLVLPDLAKGCAVAHRETIAAIATPPGRGGIGVVRVSGTAAARIAAQIVGRRPPPRRAILADFRDADGDAMDRGIVLFFPAPGSFTGEDVLELQGHGGPVVMDRLLERACALGARVARPGEFTERAFLNGRIDLAQAEAVADLIDSSSRRAARSAMRSLAGEFSKRVTDIDRAVLEVRVYLEAALDFAEEEIDFLAEDEIHQRLTAAEAAITDLLAASRQGVVLRDGLDVVIAGPPNAGKSSLMNLLLAEDRAIVTDVPGTTRDLLAADADIGGVPVRLTDTAGIRRGGDPVEVIGVERARTAVARADLVLAVEDDSLAEPSTPAVDVPRDRLLVIKNKVDLSGRQAGRVDGAGRVVRVSALTGAGLDDLRAAIVEAAGVAPGEGVYLARKRHLNALTLAARHVASARARAGEGFGDLAAEELRQVQHQLGEIVGVTSVDDLLGEIFRGFCIGK